MAVDSDKQIFEKITAGQDVLGEIVEEISRRYANDLLQFCGRILVNYQRQRLEDVLQEIFRAVYLNIQQYDINRGPEGIKSWLCGIAHNKCVDELRKEEQLKELKLKIESSDLTEQVSSNPGAQENEEHYSQIILAKRAFAELPTQERLMVATRLMSWFSREEMTKMFHFRNSASYDRHMNRIHQKMKRVIERGTQ
jgi:RNA polymerase sigma factor (sigma-70 family)